MKITQVNYLGKLSSVDTLVSFYRSLIIHVLLDRKKKTRIEFYQTNYPKNYWICHNAWDLLLTRSFKKYCHAMIGYPWFFSDAINQQVKENQNPLTNCVLFFIYRLENSLLILLKSFKGLPLKT